MKTEIIYSIVIPHRNTPDLLQRLIDSIPMREDIEIIVVDDNSDKDKKAAISRSDVRTIYIDKEHSRGAGRARNVGMDAAKGKWLLFADADEHTDILPICTFLLHLFCVVLLGSVCHLRQDDFPNT